MLSPRTFLMTLPSELIEAVLICSCSPRTVVSVAQTCRALHTLVYESPDSHLWRGLFLTTWDDPRPALDHRALVDPRIDLAPWNWAIEYRRRVSADKWLKAWRRDICLADDIETGHDTDPEWRTTALSALNALLDTFLTFRPFPVSSPIALTVLSSASSSSSSPAGNIGSGMEIRRERMTNAPPLPPLLIVLASGISVISTSRSGVRVGRVVYGPHASVLGHGPGQGLGPETVLAPRPSSSIPIPTPSLPPQLVRTLLASCAVWVYGLPAHVPSLFSADHRETDPLSDVFHRIVCITGFVPIPPPLSTSASEGTRDINVKNRQGAKLEEDSKRETKEDGEQHKEKDDGKWDGRPAVGLNSKDFPSPSQQHADARILARRRVYDMQYLRGDRLWGPYHVVTRAPLVARPGSSTPDEYGKGKSWEEPKRGRDRLGALAWAMGMDVEPDELDSDSTSDDSKDEDWHDPAVSVQGFSSHAVEGDTDVDVEPAEPEHHIISLILASANATTSTTSRRRTRRSNRSLPPDCAVFAREIKPHHLRPDYAYLASARIVVEANLRELFGGEVSNVVEHTAPGVRPGGVGMFWEDEDEILRAPARPSEPASVVSRAPPSPTTAPSAGTDSNTFELVDILSQFKNPETARPGSACGYWSGWLERQQSEKGIMDESTDAPESAPSLDGMRRPKIVANRAQLESPIDNAPTAKGKGKKKERHDESTVPAPGTGLGDWEIGPEGESCEGWDWAGVAGIWRRCVCWMDYRELLFFNLDSTKFLTLGTQEACRIIPMELRITGYSRAGLMPIYDTDERSNINVLLPDHRRHTSSTCTGYFRPPPMIHFVGTSIGSDRGMEDARKIRGSAELIGGGEVRWQLDTYPQKSDLSASSTPEWSSEGIQVGTIGCAIGVLGMWTGAEHERADPLGPFWAWKVA